MQQLIIREAIQTDVANGNEN